MASISELACSYAALILHDGGVNVTAEKIQELLSAANVTVEPYWPMLFSKYLSEKDLDDLILHPSAGAAPVAAGAAASGAAAAEEEKEEEKEEEEEEEEDLGGAAGLFGDDDDDW